MFKYTKQDSLKDCGVILLYNIIRFYNGNINLEKLRNMVKTDKDGTSIYHIVEVSNKLGLISNAYKIEFEHIKNYNLPLICHIKVNDIYPHFVLIKRISDKYVYLFDPIRGHIKYSIEKFKSEWSNIIITFKKTDNLINEKDTYKDYLKKIILSDKNYLLITFILTILYTFLTCLNSFYIQFIIDNIRLRNIIFICFILINILLIIINYIKNNLIIDYNNKIDFKLTKNIYKHIFNLPIKYHHTRTVGDIVSRIYDLFYIKNFINELSLNIIIDALTILIISIFLILINIKMFILIILFTIIYFFVYLIFRKKLLSYNNSFQENSSKVNEVLVENLLGIDTIKNLKIERLFLNKQNEFYSSFLKNNKKMNNYKLTLSSILELIINLCFIISVFYGCILYNNRIITIGKLISFGFFLNIYFSSIRNIINIDNMLISSLNAYKRLNSVFNFKEEKNIISKSFNNNILINNYKIKNNKINFNIKKNDFILINGKSGIGKSTLFKKLTKQESIKKGVILLDNNDINKFSLDYIKHKICYVSQNEYLFTKSIKDNILLYRNITDEELKKAIKVSLVDKMIKDKKIDLDYLIEENGHNLSGGERQKIIIARTLVSNPKIIIFDETMNEIDIESERKIIKNINTEYNNTLILISHRNSNKDLFNKVINLGGKENVINKRRNEII